VSQIAQVAVLPKLVNQEQLGAVSFGVLALAVRTVRAELIRSRGAPASIIGGVSLLRQRAASSGH
jgi:hypothetical protein